jgi:hypothetical protein
MRRLTSVIAAGLIGAGLALVAPSPAVASGEVLHCYFDTPLNYKQATYECVLGGGHPVGEVWHGPGLDSSDNGFVSVQGVCIINQHYSISVTYTDNGVPGFSSTPFDCWQ